jgi:hypothetical protein
MKKIALVLVVLSILSVSFTANANVSVAIYSDQQGWANSSGQVNGSVQGNNTFS